MATFNSSDKSRKVAFHLGFVAMTMLFMVACTQKTVLIPHDKTRAEAINEYIESLPKVSEEKPSDVLSGSPSIREETINGVPSVRQLESHKAVQLFEKLVALNPNTDTLWPGAIVKSNSIQSGVLSLVNVPRSSAIITLTDLTFASPDATYTRTAKTADHEKVNQEIQNLLSQKPTSATPARFSFFMKEFSSLGQALISVGLSGSWLDNELKTKLESESYEKNNNIVVSVIQSYYTITFQAPGSAAAFFPDDVAVNDLKGKVGNFAPAYISSVSYGRMLLFFVSSRENISSLKTSLDSSFNILGTKADANLSVQQKKILNESEIRVLALGGSSSGAIQLVTDKVNGIAKYLKEGQGFAKDSPAVPISYMLRYVADGSPARLSFATDYVVKTVSPIPIKGFSIKIYTETDDKDPQEGVSIEIYRGNERIAFGGPYGRGETWHDQDKPSRKPHVFDYTPNVTVTADQADQLKVRIIKERAGGNGGKGWDLSLEVFCVLSNKNQQTFKIRDRNERFPFGNGFRRRPSPFGANIIPLGNGNPADYTASLHSLSK